MSTFDDRVFEAIQGYTRDTPLGLVGIFGFVDGREKLVLSHEELVGALERLIAAGRIRESPRHQFYEPGDPGEKAGGFSGLTPREYDAACERYRKEFWRRYRELP